MRLPNKPVQVIMQSTASDTTGMQCVLTGLPRRVNRRWSIEHTAAFGLSVSTMKGTCHGYIHLVAISNS